MNIIKLLIIDLKIKKIKKIEKIKKDIKKYKNML